MIRTKTHLIFKVHILFVPTRKRVLNVRNVTGEHEYHKPVILILKEALLVLS